MDIVNNPCEKLNPSILEDVVGPQQINRAWCGDFNSHNSFWGSNDTDANGLVVEEFIDEKYLVCINNREGTRYNNNHYTEAILDLTFISSSIAGISS